MPVIMEAVAPVAVARFQYSPAINGTNSDTKLNAEVLGISVDTVFSLGKFKTEQNYTFDLLSDFNKQAIQDYGVYAENFVFGMKGVSKRAAFVIDSEGIIQYAEVLENAGNLPDFLAIKTSLESL